MGAGLSSKQITSRIYSRLKSIQAQLERAGVSVAYVKGTAYSYASLCYREQAFAKPTLPGGFNIKYGVSHASNGECFGSASIHVSLPTGSKSFGGLGSKNSDGTFEQGIAYIITNFAQKNVRAQYDITGNIIAFENGELEQDDLVILFQHLIDNGMAWSLQGSYGRTAVSLIQSGLCHQ
jgi:hypothetical protein